MPRRVAKAVVKCMKLSFFREWVFSRAPKSYPNTSQSRCSAKVSKTIDFSWFPGYLFEQFWLQNPPRIREKQQPRNGPESTWNFIAKHADKGDRKQSTIIDGVFAQNQCWPPSKSISKTLGVYNADCVVWNANSSFMFWGSRLCSLFCAGSWRLFAVSFAIVVCGVWCDVWCVVRVCCVCVVCVCVCLCWGGPTKQRCKIDADAWPKFSKKVLEGSKIMKMDRKFMQKLYKMVLGGLGCPLDVPVDKKVPEKRDQVHQGIWISHNFNAIWKILVATLGPAGSQRGPKITCFWHKVLKIWEKGIPKTMPEKHEQIIGFLCEK